MAAGKCEKCGREVGDNLAVCPACGAAVAAATPESQDNLQPQRLIKPVVLVLAALLACFLVVSLVLTLFSTGKVEVVSLQPTNVAAPDLQATKTKAESGDAAAQFALGQIYAKGQGVPMDYSAAAKWYRLAADQGNADGQNALGELYEAGQGVKIDNAEAVRWYRKAADQGHSGGQYNLGVMFEYGRGVSKNSTEAAKWFRLAAAQGEALAQFNIGQRYDRGLGVNADPVEAYQWYCLAAAQGIPDAAQFRDELKSKMSRDQIAEGQRRATSFVPRKTSRGAVK